ncbi:MAG: hypothetical protein E7586_00450 [Ruminococcaceae bacterium]|nr:hypothetical protein [Oscillospiraceae bacterium]
MIKFIRENSSAIVKFIITHIVMSVLGIMLGLAILTLENDTPGISPIALIGSAFTIGFMCFMHYDDMFFIAVKEGIRVRTEGGKIDIFKGLKITLIAYAPVMLIGIIVIIANLFGSEDSSAITLLLYYAFQGSFISLYKILQYLGVVGYVILTLIPAIVASSLGYAIGAKDKTLRGLMGMDVAPPFDGPLERKPKNKK